MVSFSCRISPETLTVIFFERSPLAMAVDTSAMLRTWAVRFDAMELTLSVDSPSWDPNMVHEVLPIEFYIDQFCERLDRNATLITNSHGSEGNWFQHLATNWRAIRNRYLSELARKGVPVQQAQEPEQMLQGIVTGGDIGDDLSVFNGGFAADFWTFDSMPPWGGPVSVGNGNNNMSHIFMPVGKSNAI